MEAQEELARAAALLALDRTPDAPPGSDDDDDEEVIQSRIDHIGITQKFIEEIQVATFENGKLDQDVVDRLRDPDEGPVDISDPDIRLSLDLFLSCNKASQDTYTSVRASVLQRYPSSGILSYYEIKKLVAQISGVVSINDDMCINSCHAFTGPFSELESCSICAEPRYDPVQLAVKHKKVPRQQACTIPLGPQVQALRRSQHGAAAMRYRDQKTKEILDSITDQLKDSVYDDTFCGNDYLDLHARLGLTSDDTTVSFSLDGAQLYQNKKSDTWIGIWIINDYHPTTRYKKKHVLPALVVPGPNKPKNLDSFMFRAFHHVSALQRENGRAGLRVWDAINVKTINSRVIFLLGGADAVALTELDGRVGHHGAYGCRIGCYMKGRHKPNAGHYYAVHLRPNHYSVADCNHPDFDFSTIPQPLSPDEYQANLSIINTSTNQTDYELNRKETGLSKPSILSGLNQRFMLPLPRCFSVDLMHLLSLNLGELLIPLWRGTLACDASDDKSDWDWATLKGDVWVEHGKLVAAATPYFPASFHRPPRNPVEKINSGYKATEYYLYLFALGPALFRKVLPRKYWRNFCKLAHGVRIIIQRRITGEQAREAHSYLVQFVEEYENIYYQRRVSRIHFCRPSLHTLLHAAPEITRVGPGSYNTQYTMERAIGDWGKDIRQPSNPYANLSHITLRQSQVNALKAIYPELDKDANPGLPNYAYDIRNGYIFLTPRDRYSVGLGAAVAAFCEVGLDMEKVTRWGRLRLPNGQIARSVHSESRRGTPKQRISRNVKVGVFTYWYPCKLLTKINSLLSVAS